MSVIVFVGYLLLFSLSARNHRWRHWPPCQCTQNRIHEFNQTGNISTLNGSFLKLVDKFTSLRCSVSSTGTEIYMRLAKAWTAIDRLSVIWKSDLTDKMKCSFFQAAVLLILLYGCTTWTLTKWMEKKLDGNIEQVLEATPPQSSNYTTTYHPSWKLGKLDEPDMQDTAGEAGTSSWVMFSYGPLTWPCKSRATSLNLYTAALWGYGM